MINVNLKPPHIVFCDCGNHAIGLEYDSDFEHLYMSFWQYGRNYKRTRLDKLKMIWKIIKDGTPYTDMVILNEVERYSLLKAIEEHTYISDEPTTKTTTTEIPLLYPTYEGITETTAEMDYTTLNIEEDCDIKCPDYFYGSSFPPYVYATEGDYKVALKRIAENTYYRDSGAWEVDAIIKENGEMFTVSEISSINNLKLVACTHKEYKKDNRGYV